MKTSENSREEAKRLKNKEILPFIDELDPKNPYGPNFEELPYKTKQFYKFNRMRKYVHFSKEDNEHLLK